jgi:CheY-specific phosphatase CheX
MIESLKAATFEVLETMFFLFPENPEDNADLFHGPALKAWVPVKGPKNFRIGLMVPLDLAREMAANFLGVEKDEVAQDKMDDVVKETANMVAGSFLWKEKAPGGFHLETPEVLRLDLDGRNWSKKSNSILLVVGDAGLEVFLEKS